MKFCEHLAFPFQPVQIIRRPGPYGRLLNLEPGTPMAPDPEFLVRLLTDHSSHQAYVRSKAGNNYKNLENFIRGKHKLSSTTKQGTILSLGITMDVFDELEGCSQDGPLLPEILNWFRLFEELSMRVSSSILSTEVRCSCCGANILDDVDTWWSKQAIGLKPREYHFCERLLKAILGVSLIEHSLLSFNDQAKLSLDRLDALSHPERHPVGNWLSEVSVTLGCDSLAKLTTALQLHSSIFSTLSYGRLKKWSSGQDVMPMSVGKAIADISGEPNSATPRLQVARSIALVTDFVVASSQSETSFSHRRDAQKIIHLRLAHLRNNLSTAAIESKKILRAAPQS